MRDWPVSIFCSQLDGTYTRDLKEVVSAMMISRSNTTRVYPICHSKAPTANVEMWLHVASMAVPIQCERRVDLMAGDELPMV